METEEETGEQNKVWNSESVKVNEESAEILERYDWSQKEAAL